MPISAAVACLGAITQPDVGRIDRKGGLQVKYSLWTVEHESSTMVTLIKERDTNSSREVDKWMGTWGNVASFYRAEDELPADYVQTFQET